MNKFSLITASVAGILSLLYYVCINYFYFHDFGFVETGRIVFASAYGYFDYLLLPLCVFVGTKFYKQKYSNYKALVAFGWKTSLLAASLFSVFIFTALSFATADYFRELISLIKEMNAPANKPEPFVKSLLVNIAPIEKTELYRSPHFYALVNFAVYFLLGILAGRLFLIQLRKNTLRPGSN